jgi:hypothetical protein
LIFLQIAPDLIQDRTDVKPEALLLKFVKSEITGEKGRPERLDDLADPLAGGERLLVPSLADPGGSPVLPGAEGLYEARKIVFPFYLQRHGRFSLCHQHDSNLPPGRTFP